MWWEEYIGKPWEDFPTPPHSFSCGELVRYILNKTFNLDIPPIRADASNLRQCLVDLAQPEAFGFVPFLGVPRPFDIVYLMRRVRRDHVALCVNSPQGLAFLHCIQGRGVVCETEFEMKATTFSAFMEWRRHKDITEEMVRCLV